MRSPCFTPADPCSGIPFPPPGPCGAGSPASTVLWDAPTPCRPSRRTSLPSADNTAPVSPCFVSPTGRRHEPGRPGGLHAEFPPSALDAEATGPPRFLRGPQRVPAVLLDPGGPTVPGPYGLVGVASRILQRRGLRIVVAFEAQSHGSHTRCLRLAVPVTRTPPKTRFRRWPALPGGSVYPLGPRGPSAFSLYMAHLLTQAFLAH